MALDELSGGRRWAGALRWLGPLAPAAVRRAARVGRVVEEMWGSAARGRGVFPGGGFDPDVGASGRPAPMYEHVGGKRSTRHTTALLTPKGHLLEWTGSTLTIMQPSYLKDLTVRGIKVRVPVPPPGRPARSGGRPLEVAEVALFVACWDAADPREPDAAGRVRRGSLHFLDAQGYSVIVRPELQSTWRVVADVVEAAGLPIRVYAFFSTPRAAKEITRLLFPHRPSCREV